MNIRMVTVLVVSLYTSRITLEILGFTDFGIYSAVGGVVSLLGFFTSSLSNVTQRYLSIGHGKNDNLLTNAYFNQCFELLIITSILLLLLGEGFGVWFVENELVIPADSERAAYWVFQFAIVSCIIAILQVPYVSVIIAREKMKVYAYVCIAEIALRLVYVFALRFFASTSQLEWYSAFMALSLLLPTVFYAIYCRRFPECRLRPIWDKRLVKELTSFIGYNLFGCLSYAAGYQGGNILLNLFFGPVMNTARTIAFQVSSAINRFAESIFTSVKPQIIKSYAENDIDYMTTLIRFSSTLGFIFMLILVTPILFDTNTVLTIWLKDIPDYAVSFTRLALFDSLIGVMCVPLWLAVNATGKIGRNQTYGRGFILLSFPVSYIAMKFVPDPNIPFWSIIVGQTGYLAYSIYDVKSQLGLSITTYVNRILRPTAMVATSIVSVAAIECILIDSGPVRLMAIALSGLLTGGIMTYLFLLTDSMRQKVCKSLTKITGTI